MGRLRQSLATSAEDRAMQGHLLDAVRSLSQAAEVCGRKVASLGGRHSPDARRAAGIQHTIGGIIARVQEVAHLDARAAADADLMSEDARIQQHREKADARREAARQARAQQAAGGS